MNLEILVGWDLNQLINGKQLIDWLSQLQMHQSALLGNVSISLISLLFQV